MMTDTSGATEFELTHPESEYYKMWILQTEYKISPRQWEEDFTPEEQNAFWVMLQYQNEKNKYDSFMAKSRAADKKNAH